ncbi:hypothetical protein C8J56DRAFT_803336, partial [Mycena floridula]
MFQRLRNNQGQIQFTSIDIPQDLLAPLGAKLLELCDTIPEFKDAFFLHEFRGEKGKTLHSPNDAAECRYHRALFLDSLDQTTLQDENWFIDLAFEVSLPEHVVFLKSTAHPHILDFALPSATPRSREKLRQSSNFRIDFNAQLADIAGFRTTTGAQAGDPDHVQYLNVYTTDCKPTYQLHRGTYERIRPAQLLEAESRSKVINQIESIGDMYFRQGVNKTPCATRIELRIRLDEDDVQKWQYLPSELVERCLLAHPADTYWYFRYVRETGIKIALTRFHKSPPPDRCFPETLLLIACLVYMHNYIIYR